MKPGQQARKHEVSFCADVKSWADALFRVHPEWPFTEAHIEEYGPTGNRRQDFRVRIRDQRKPVLVGEVKMPGTVEGRNPYADSLIKNAFEKADDCQAQFFFTWNVNTFVLFDRSQWRKPVPERRVRQWDLGLALTDAGQCDRDDVQAVIRDRFLPEFFAYFANILSGKVPNWAMPPDEVFLRSLESHLNGPTVDTTVYLAGRCAEDATFAADLQRWLAEEMHWTFDPGDGENWQQTLKRAAQTLCYVFINRAIFYHAVRARHPDLLALGIPAETKDPGAIYDYFRRRFKEAVEATGDYEPIFYPDVEDWAGALIFAGPNARTDWKAVFDNLDDYNFRDISHDIVGGIFQGLIAPEERQKFGQFFTHEDIVDVINAFCIRRAGDVVLDPACGSGSFLVRAYHRKAWLGRHRGGGRRNEDADKTHEELLREIYGCDIALFPAHLATLNLAARQIEEAENYPLITRGNFFEIIERPDQFAFVPVGRGPENKVAIPLKPLDAVIGNPPYVRQEQLTKRGTLKREPGLSRAALESRRKNTKEHFQELATAAWPGLKLSGRSDLHCYFWPVAAKHLKEGGYFGFLTSSSWLDVEYGFALQKWILGSFRLMAVLESVDEPWFEDARVKTCVTIMQRCSDPSARDENVVRFVRLQKPLKDILGKRAPGDETARQEAATKLRDLIESTAKERYDGRLRIIPIRQGDLWREGVEAGKVLGRAALGNGGDENGNGNGNGSGEEEDGAGLMDGSDGYTAGKWGRYVRAPDLFFRLMREYGQKFVRLGEIAEIRRGITSGCDAFFMPHDVTTRVLAEVRDGRMWRDVALMTSCPLRHVQKGRVRIVEAGDGTLHPIEAKFLRPEVHSLMAVDRPIIRAADIDRVVLWVGIPLRELAGTYVSKYIRWGAKQKFPSKKSRAVTVPERSTCAARPLWYDLTGVPTGTIFWPMAQQYRHIIPANPEGLVCNHNLFYLREKGLNTLEASALTAVLNSTVLGLFKTYYGRYAGTEGALKTEVVDVNLMPVPNPAAVAPEVADRLLTAFASMQRRTTGPLVEEVFMECHTVADAKVLAQRPVALPRELLQEDRRQLDDAVLQMLGVSDPNDRQDIMSELYTVTAAHYRQIRIMEIQKQVQRAGGNNGRLTARDLADAIWHALGPEEQGSSVTDWLTTEPASRVPVEIPDGTARLMPLLPGRVDFHQGGAVHYITCAGPEQAALVVFLADLGIRGPESLPADEPTCRRWRAFLAERLAAARAKFHQLAGRRTGTPALRDDIVNLLVHKVVFGVPRKV